MKMGWVEDGKNNAGKLDDENNQNEEDNKNMLDRILKMS